MVALGVDIESGGVQAGDSRSRQVGFYIDPVIVQFVSFLFAFLAGGSL